MIRKKKKKAKSLFSAKEKAMKPSSKPRKIGLPKISEQALVRQAVAYLTLNGCYVWRENVGAMRIRDRFVRFGHKGVSDVLGVSPDGRMIAVELKIRHNAPTMFQVDFLKAINDRGGIGILAYSLEELIEKYRVKMSGVKLSASISH
jgi:hypothetical protein